MLTTSYFQSCLVGIVIPEEQFLLSWAAENRIAGTFGELCQNRVVKKSILDDLAELGKKSGLKSFELVRKTKFYFFSSLVFASSVISVALFLVTGQLIWAPVIVARIFQLKDIVCHDELLSVENGLLTPTLKTKRPECRKAFAKELFDMYKTLQ